MRKNPVSDFVLNVEGAQQHVLPVISPALVSENFIYLSNEEKMTRFARI